MKNKSIAVIIFILISFKVADAQEIKFTNVKSGVEYYGIWEGRGPIHSSEVDELKVWMSGIELWNELYKAIEAGKAEAYSPEDLTIKFNIDSVNMRLNRIVNIDTINVLDPYTLEEELRVVIEEFDPSIITGWDFIEDITYDVNAKKVIKKVAYIIPKASIYDKYEGYFIGEVPVMAVKLSPGITSSPNAQTITFNSFKNRVETGLWGNANYTAWEQQFKSDTTKKLELWNELSKLLETGKAEAYSPDDLTLKLSREEIKKISEGTRTDTIYVEDYNTGELIYKVVSTQLNPADIASWNFIESMVYNVTDNTLTKKVEYIIPRLTVYDDANGWSKGWRPLMAIKLN